MADFVYDDTNLPAPKSDLKPLPGSADPNKYVTAEDWNTTIQGIKDTKSAVLRGLFHGLQALTEPPSVPPDGEVRLFLLTNGVASPGKVLTLCILWPNGTYTPFLESDPH